MPFAVFPSVILRFSEGDISRLVLVESHRLNSTVPYPMDFSTRYMAFKFGQGYFTMALYPTS